MERGVTLLDDLRRMKEEMDRAWNNLLEKSATAKEWEIWQGLEKIPKFEGTGRRIVKSRSNKIIIF